MRRLPVVIAPLLATSLLLAGCGGKDEKKSAEPTPSVSPTAAPEPILNPLTGAEVKRLPKHPVMVVKVDNVAAAAPQQGVGQADMVVEELVEGGYTRLAGFYYSKLPELVGPVRSMRASDIGIVSPVGAKIITSGAASQTIARIQGAGIQFFQEGAKGTFRDTGRRAPHNLMANVQEIGSGLAEPEKKVKNYFAFGDASALPRGKKASTISASFGARTTDWNWDGTAYQPQNSFEADDDQFTPDTVLALTVEITDAGYLDPSGATVPESHLLGQGKGVLFHQGRALAVTWKKAKVDGTITLFRGKTQIGVPAGKTFVELVPKDQGGVTFQP